MGEEDVGGKKRKLEAGAVSSSEKQVGLDLPLGGIS